MSLLCKNHVSSFSERRKTLQAEGFVEVRVGHCFSNAPDRSAVATPPVFAAFRALRPAHRPLETPTNKTVWHFIHAWNTLICALPTSRRSHPRPLRRSLQRSPRQDPECDCYLTRGSSRTYLARREQGCKGSPKRHRQTRSPKTLNAQFHSEDVTAHKYRVKDLSDGCPISARSWQKWDVDVEVEFVFEVDFALSTTDNRSLPLSS